MEAFTKYYKITGITLQVNCDLPILDETFHPKFKLFETKEPGKDNIIINHYFRASKTINIDLFENVYDKLPWKIFKCKDQWLYQRFHLYNEEIVIDSSSFINHAHTQVNTYHNNEMKQKYSRGLLDSLTLFQSDQILLAKILADRNGCFFHSNGVIFNEKGFLFLGHSGNGKSTIAKMLKNEGGTILCDDRMIVKQEGEKIMLHGNWCHGSEMEFSTQSIPLDKIFFIHKSAENKISKIDDNSHNIHQLLAFIVRPFLTEDWWTNSLKILETIVQKTPCYNLWFDKSGKIVTLIDNI